jgi:hypothetical protein
MAKSKKVTLDISTRRGARKLVKLQEQGWEIVSEHKRGALAWKPGQVDYVLKKVEPDRANKAAGPGSVATQFVRNLVSGLKSESPAASGEAEAESALKSEARVPSAAGLTPDFTEQIRKLGQLRDEGLLTPEEFETKKAELLSRL